VDLIRIEPDGFNYLAHIYIAKSHPDVFKRFYPNIWGVYDRLGLKSILDSLSSNTPNYLEELYKIGCKGEGYLYRGIPNRDYATFLHSGNSKSLYNITNDEAIKLQELGVKPDAIMYASDDRDIKEAWHFATNFNPSILVIYHKKYFTRVEGEAYMYELQEGIKFIDAVYAFIIIRYS